MLKDTMKNSGIVGVGGAGFPSYAKLADGADTLIVNGSECEPLLYTDLVILQEELPTVITGINAVLDEMRIPRAFLAVKDHTATRLFWEEGKKLDKRISVKILPDVYPMGDEISLIYQVTGRIVKPGNLPISAGVIVYNVETAYNIANGLNGKPVTEKWIMIGGKVKEPCVIKVPIGVRVSDLLRKFGVTLTEGDVLIDGGPSMGKIVNCSDAVVTKTTKSLLVLPDDIPAIIEKRMDYRMANKRAETACCQCTRCTDLCPRHLLGYPLEPHKMVRSSINAVEISPVMVLSATLCCGCGICETLACCQGISPKAVINNYKAILAKNRMKYVANTEVEVSSEREYRMITSDKWMRTLGVAKYDKAAVYRGKYTDFCRVDIMLSQHIGAPSVACVSEGDTVRTADIIANSAEGLSVPQFASIDGKVTYVDAKKIVIERV